MRNVGWKFTLALSQKARRMYFGSRIESPPKRGRSSDGAIGRCMEMPSDFLFFDGTCSLPDLGMNSIFFGLVLPYRDLNGSCLVPSTSCATSLGSRFYRLGQYPTPPEMVSPTSTLFDSGSLGL